MTRKTFDLVARIVATACPDAGARRMMAEEFAEAFTKENPRFDRTRFLVACGVK